MQLRTISVNEGRGLVIGKCILRSAAVNISCPLLRSFHLKAGVNIYSTDMLRVYAQAIIEMYYRKLLGRSRAQHAFLFSYFFGSVSNAFHDASMIENKKAR
jgi:hypothetical protein